MENLLHLIKIIVWPITTIWIVYIFKSQIQGAINRIKSIESNGILVGLEVENLGSKKSQKKVVDDKKIAIDKPATLFWIANDLMWLQDRLIRNTSTETIVAGLKNLNTYIKSIGLKDTLAEKEINRLLENIVATQSMGFASLSQEYRISLIQQIETIKWYIASQVEQKEKGFKKLRVFSKNN